MTDQEIEQNVDAYKAWLKGEPVEIVASFAKWEPIEGYHAITRKTILRRKPAPKLRAWKPEEVPVGALFRGVLWHENEIAVILWTDGKHFRCGGSEYFIFNLSDYDPINFFYSTDGGKTWKPCGVEEQPNQTTT